MSFNTKVKSPVSADTSATSSPSAVEAHQHGSEFTSLPTLRTDATPSGATLSPVRNTSSTSQSDASPQRKEKKLVSFKDRQRQGTSAHAGAGCESGGKNSLARTSETSTASPPSPSTLSLAPSREPPHQHSTFRRTTEAASSSSSTGCVFTAVEPPSRDGRSGVSRAPNPMQMRIAGQGRISTTTAVRRDLKAPTSLALQACSSSCCSPTNRQASPPHAHSANLESSPLSQSPRDASPVGTTRIAAVASAPKLRLKSSSDCCTSANSSFGAMATQMSGSDTKAQRLVLRAPTIIGGVITPPTQFSSPASPEDFPALLSVSSLSTSSPKMSFKDRQRAAAASRTPLIATGTAVSGGLPPSATARSSAPWATPLQSTAHSPAAGSAEMTPFLPGAPVVQHHGPSSGFLSFSTSPLLPARAPAAEADHTARTPGNQDDKTNTEGTGESSMTRTPLQLPLAEHAAIRNPKPVSPLQTSVPPWASSPKRCANLAHPQATAPRPHFRFFAQRLQAQEEESESRGVMEKKLAAQTPELHNRVCGAATVYVDPVDANEGNKNRTNEADSPLACTQNETHLPFYNPDIGTSPIEFTMAIPSQRQTAMCSGAASRESAISVVETCAQHSDTALAEGQRSSQTTQSAITSNPETILGSLTCSHDPARFCTGTHTESLEAAASAAAAAASTESRIQSRRGSAELSHMASTSGPRRLSSEFEQQHYKCEASGIANSKAGVRDQFARTHSKIVGRWKHNHQPQASQHGSWTPRELASTSSTLGPAASTKGLPSFNDAHQRHTVRSRRGQRSKMLAPDGALITTPRSSHVDGPESSSLPKSSFPKTHQRSRTVDNFALMASASGSCGSATLGSFTQAPGSTSSRSRLMSQPTLSPELPPHALRRVMTASQSSLVGSADMRCSREGVPISLCQVPPTAHLVTEKSAIPPEMLLAKKMMDTGGVQASPFLSPLPAVHPRTSSHISSLSKAPFAMAAVLVPHTQSADDLFSTTPTIHTDTPMGFGSVDEAHTCSTLRQLSVTHTSAYPSTGGGIAPITAPTDEAEDSDGDYMLRTVNSHLSTDNVLNTTTAELRKLRRRSTYSSLHYGTMTGFHHRRNKQPLGSQSDLRHVRRHSRSGVWRRQQHTKANNGNAEVSMVLFSETNGSGEDGALSRADKEYTDDDDETMLVQKGSDEDFASDEADRTRERGDKHGGRFPNRSGERGAAATAGVAAEDDDGRENAHRRTVGLWTSVEHVFLPRYELVPEKASTVPLTVPASPKSNRNPSISAVSSDMDAKQRQHSPLGNTLDKKERVTPSLTPHSDPQPAHPAPATDSTSTSQRPSLVLLGAPSSSFVMPTPLSAPRSQSMYIGGNVSGLQPSGLVVLPDANCSGDARGTPSLSCSQIRRTSPQASSAKPLEPEDYTFGTVASVYNLDPAEEETLQEGSCDAKVAARLVFDVANGVMLMDPEDEVSRYERQGSISVDDQGSPLSGPPEQKEESLTRNSQDASDDEDNGGACHCDAAFIAKDFKGPDCSRYDARDLYDHCSRCQRRPAAFLCLHCLEAVCPSHVRQHHLRNSSECTLFLNLLDIMNSFDRIFWCEKCHLFTWKYTDVYDALVDQIASTHGTYLKQPARDIHCVGYEVRLKDATLPAAVRRAAGSVVGAESLPFSQSTHAFSPVTIPNHATSASGPATAATAASETPPEAPRNLQLGPSMSSLPNGRSESTRKVDAGLLSCTPGSPFGGSALMRALPTSATSPSPSQLPVHSPMQQFLSRDLLELSVGNAVTVGEPVTKLSALGASVQGWRATQEDAEAVFLVDIPALSEEVVNRKELQAVVAAATKKPVETLDSTSATLHDPLPKAHGCCELKSSHSDKPLILNTTPRTRDLKAHKHSLMSANGAGAAAATEAAKRDELEVTPRETMPMAVFCMFDGHGGDAVAKLAARHFEAHLRHAIKETRPDDVRARALLFFLEAETDSAVAARATAPWPPLSLASVQPGDGTLSCTDQTTAVLTTSAYPAAARVSSPSGSPDVFSGRVSHAHCLTPLHKPCSAENLFAPDNHSPAQPSEPFGHRTSLLPDAVDVGPSLADELRNAPSTGSLSLVVPVTAESLRLHVAGGAHGLEGASVKDTLPDTEDASVFSRGKNRHSPNTRADYSGNANSLPGNSNFLKQFRKTGATLDTWDAVEEDLQDPISASASVISPLIGMHIPSSIVAAENLRRESGSNFNTNLASGSTAACVSPAAVVSIPEMEMLRQYFASIMEDALISLDDYLRSTPEGVRGDYDKVGCTACVVGITANFVLCANIGDSGAAFYTKDRIKEISVKHRVSDEAEQARIRAAGYAINNNRIEGMSAVPRALGDFDFKQCGGVGPHKQAVSAVPDVTIMPVPNDTDRWGIVLGCDGVWDTATLHQVHVALTNTVNDLTVSGSAMDAVIRGADLYERHLRGTGTDGEITLLSLPSRSPPRPGCALHSSGAAGNSRRTSSPTHRENLVLKTGTNRSISAHDDEDEYDAVPRLPQVDPILLTAAAGVFAQCVAPEDNDEGIGLDNCSLIIIERRNVQE
ncbi:hypothetical protein JKF63_03859 [Porcisia hertigi]|uniref:PPM-type phosphatase domain-containing protein n=1 Tax=Porcisia hertigi TaxID=2761500 RepID=A0A836HR92_9TRYP|nr:hypothetical protein JKF63_03859 [Porcisia hertigi]